MLNQCILVGRVVSIVRDKEHNIITLKIDRYKDENQISYDTVPCRFNESVWSNEVKEGYLLGVKARVYSDQDGVICIKGEKMTFISTTKKENLDE